MWTTPNERNKDKRYGTMKCMTKSCLAFVYFFERQINYNLNQYPPRQLSLPPPGNNNNNKNIVNKVFGASRSPARPSVHEVYTLVRGEGGGAIIFSDADYEGIDHDHTEAQVVTLQ